jgi:endonuclease/exonuclease/phosphatase family metal-dependent hydrolase
MKLRSLLCSLSLLTAALAQTPASLRIGTWNLEFLGATGNFRNNLPPRTAADHAAIGKKLVELGVAVVAVQEINDDATLQQVANGAGPTWRTVLGQSGSWDDGKTAQHSGFVYDSAVLELLFAEEVHTLPREFGGKPIFHRVPLTAAFRHRSSGADFRLVTVHFKAGQKADDQHKRRGEAEALAGWLEALRTVPNEDPDVLLLGDFNSTYGTEPQLRLEQGGGFQYLVPATPGPTIMHFAEPIDQIVAAAGCAELRRDSMQIDNDCDAMPKERWRQTYSDHFPVTVELLLSSDDDPAAAFARLGPATGDAARSGSAPPAARGPRTDVANASGWPPAVGSQVRIECEGNRTLEGTLLQPLPPTTGWVVLRIDGRTCGVPMTRVLSLRPL